MKIAEILLERMETQTTSIEEAIASIKKDNMVDVSDIDKDIAYICDELDALPPKDAQKLEVPMAKMIGKLEELATELQAFQQRIPEEE